MTTKKKVAKAKVVKKVKKPATLRDVLDVIDNALAKQDNTARDLWSVLTGLRGPDNPNDSRLKDKSTVYIRQAAFPETAKLARTRMYNAVNNVIMAASDSISMEVPTGPGHFKSHARTAMKALKLESVGVSGNPMKDNYFWDMYNRSTDAY